MSEIKPGIYEGVPFSEYLSWPCFHKSMVAPTLRSTEHLQQHIEEEKSRSKVMDFGSLVDAMLLEPDTFATDFVLTPETYINSKKQEAAWTLKSSTCRKWVEDVHAEGKTPYNKEDLDKADTIIQNIRGHKTAGDWLSGGRSQVAIVWEDPETGILCKARMDYLKQDRIVDLKTTFDASKRTFARTLNNQLYHVQAAMYSGGWTVLNKGEVLPFGFVAAESEAPHCVATYETGEDTLLTGTNLFRAAIRRYKDFKEMGATGYSQFPEIIDVPVYAMVLEEDFIDA